ncbi:hypothetical protein [Gilliamella sp. ESL0250]|uniref:hypothetical protein n=1 Tax=Gilliamella sp. ESL0250 TaxID=2705036 RepID=UPI0015803321|nr:hypothetical protein [Gilliamella sp. ESL0250]NUF48298.1 hypothetical protein [Gilliamella sp. ESL0250]
MGGKAELRALRFNDGKSKKSTSLTADVKGMVGIKRVSLKGIWVGKFLRFDTNVVYFPKRLKSPKLNHIHIGFIQIQNLPKTHYKYLILSKNH